MREIKFRAWDTDTNQYSKPHMCVNVGVLALNDEAVFEVGIDGVLNIRPDSDRLILMQYTGFKDKNGVEIYEGDIVGLVHKKYGVQNTKKIIWDDVHACFDWEDANGDSWPDGFTGFYDEYVVIGNIYENPELLETNA